jgi:hypothetical protein
MKIDVVLVGPWERLLADGLLKKQHSDFFIALRSRSEVGKLIYSCSASPVSVDHKYFDEVIYSQPEVHNEISGAQNINTKNLIRNSRAGISAANAEYVVKTRSDLVISDLDSLFSIIFSKNKKIIVDYEIKHSLLIPYYYPDFFVAGRRNLVLKVFDDLTVGHVSNNGNQKVLSLSPYKALTAGFFKKNFEYTEYAVWRNYLFNNGTLSKVVAMLELSNHDFFRSIKFLKENIVLINRRKLFVKDIKFVYKTQFSRFYFDNCSVLRFDYRFYVLISYHFFLFIKLSFVLVLRKLKNIR